MAKRKCVEMPKFKPLQMVVAKKCQMDDFGSHYLWSDGAHLIYLGEVLQMPGHVVVAAKDGHVYWGYHADNFRHPRKNEI